MTQLNEQGNITKHYEIKINDERFNYGIPRVNYLLPYLTKDHDFGTARMGTGLFCPIKAEFVFTDGNKRIMRGDKNTGRIMIMVSNFIQDAKHYIAKKRLVSCKIYDNTDYFASLSCEGKPLIQNKVIFDLIIGPDKKQTLRTNLINIYLDKPCKTAN